MVPVWFAGNQLPPNVMKRSHKVKVMKKDVHLRDDNLADDEGNITELKRMRKQKLITVSPSPKSDDSSITKLNWVYIFGKKLISFMRVKMKTKNAQVPENNN